MAAGGAKGNKRREEVGTCWPLEIMVVEEPLGESDLAGRARGGSLWNEFVLGDVSPKRLALGCSKRSRLPCLDSEFCCCLRGYRELEGSCFGRLPPAASTLEEWRGRRVYWRATGGMAESRDNACPVSISDVVLWRPMSGYTNGQRSTTKTTTSD